MAAPLPDRFHADPKNWRLGMFYVCREDRRLIVPKRIAGLGWTLNFGRPMAPLLIVFLLGFVLGTLKLARLLGLHGEAYFGLKLVLAVGVVAFCYRMSHAAAEGEAGSRRPSDATDTETGDPK